MYIWLHVSHNISHVELSYFLQELCMCKVTLQTPHASGHTQVTHTSTWLIVQLMVQVPLLIVGSTWYFEDIMWKKISEIVYNYLVLVLFLWDEWYFCGTDHIGYLNLHLPNVGHSYYHQSDCVIYSVLYEPLVFHTSKTKDCDKWAIVMIGGTWTQ